MAQVFIQRTTESRYTNIMNSTIEEKESVENQEWKLTAHDRCDRCGSQAYVKIVGSTGELLFCGHHYNKIVNDPNAYTKMMAFMLVVLDERDRLIENKLVGSEN